MFRIPAFAGRPPGIYKNEIGEDIELTPDGLLHYPAQGVLYGSAVPLNSGIGNMMKVTNCTLQEVVRMASTNPARLYGLNDRGSLESGKRADLIVFSLENEKMKIRKTYVKGQLVFEADE